MRDRARITAWGLALAGLIPFVGCAAMMLLSPVEREVWLGALIAYAAVILSFLGGTRWGAELAGPAPRSSILILSNLPALVAWAALLPFDLPERTRLSLLALALVMMWFWDRDRPPLWYPALRTTATVGAVLSLLLAAFAPY